jgi:hypothetical protein
VSEAPAEQGRRPFGQFRQALRSHRSGHGRMRFVMEVLMPIRTKRHDKNAHLSQPVYVAGIRPAPPAHSRASYAALQTGLGVLGGWA